MPDVYVVGSHSTRFKKWPDQSIKDLTRMTYLGALEDARIPADDIEFAYFSNCSWGVDIPPFEDKPGTPGQMSLRGHVAFAPLVEEGLFPERVPCVNVEGACASASLAFHAAWKDILSGQSQVALALGAEKLFHPGFMGTIMAMFERGTDVEQLPRLFEQFAQLARENNKDFGTGGDRSMFMDIYATMAAWHMNSFGTTQRQLAIVASKNHWHGSMNPLAQYQFEVPVEVVLADYEVSWPLTRAMCAPIGDGAASAILCSGEYLKGLPSEIQKRATKVLGSAIGSGKQKSVTEPTVSHWTAQKAYNIAGIGPEDVDVTELHDASAFYEIYITEMLGFCPIGEGGRFAESGATRIDGSKPINPSGGLESKGHPMGATGLSQINEIITQLRGEAGARQVKNPEIGLVENGGGVVSVEEAACGVTILQKSDM
ncbi:MAG: thiolase family protein [Ignavibacteriales bacterium]